MLDYLPIMPLTHSISQSAVFCLPLAPTSQPIGLCIDDISNTTITLKWRTPERVGAAHLEGYGVEYCKEGSKYWGKGSQTGWQGAPFHASLQYIALRNRTACCTYEMSQYMKQ